MGVVGLVWLLMVAQPALAGGTGYNLSYTAQANSAIIPSVDLVSASTTYTSGPNLTASLTVAGTPVTDSSNYSYVWLFGGALSTNATAWAFVENNNGFLHSQALSLPEQISFTESGSTLSISVATDLVGPASSFSFNGEASKGDSSNTATYSFLGTYYSGSVKCTGTNCTGTGTNSNSGSSGSSIPPGEIIWPIVIVVVVVIVILLLLRRRRQPAMMMPPPSSPTTMGGANPSWQAPPPNR